MPRRCWCTDSFGLFTLWAQPITHVIYFSDGPHCCPITSSRKPHFPNNSCRNYAHIGYGGGGGGWIAGRTIKTNDERYFTLRLYCREWGNRYESLNSCTVAIVCALATLKARLVIFRSAIKMREDGVLRLKGFYDVAQWQVSRVRLWEIK